MDIEGHGGGCCGITHIFEFGNDPASQGYDYGYISWQRGNRKTYLEMFKEKLKKFLDWQYEDVQLGGYEAEERYPDYEMIKTDKKFSCILEACLTDEQMMKWAPHLKESGFKVVNRFLNSNSGNVVNVLHYNPAGRRKIPEAPYKW